MTTLCITGTPGRDFDIVSKLLFNGGLAPAKPIERETTITIEDWHARVSPLLARQQAPGRLWEQLAGDLLLANFQQPQWGWAAPASLDALEFWSELEPGLGFLLLTSDPQEYLAHYLLEDSGEAGVNETDCLQQWRDQHERMLAFYLDNPERCLLVSARQARANPSALAEKLKERWGLKLELSSSYFPVLAGNSRQGAPVTLANYVAEKALVGQEHGLSPLRDELQAAQVPLAEPDVEADTDGNLLGSANLSLASILRDYQQRCAKDLSETERKALETLRRENEQLLARLRHVQEQLEATTENQQRLEQELSEIKALPSVSPQHKAELEGHRQENELLLLQLHQVQEELEATFLEQRKSKEARASSEEAARRASAERDQANQSKQLAEQQVNEAKQENKLLLLQLHQVQEELEAFFMKHQESTKVKAASEEAVRQAVVERDRANQSRQQAELNLDHAKKENELSLLQLNQAQEELEATFLKQRESKEARAASEEAARRASAERDQANQSKQLVEQQLNQAEQENELLLLQLNQVQEELEHYFRSHHQVSQEADKLRTDNVKLRHQLQAAQQQNEQPQGFWARLGGSKPKSTEPKLAYDSVQLRHEQVNPDYEHLWVSLKDASFDEHYAPEWQFRLSCAGVKVDEFGQQPKLEIPEQSEQLLQHWFAESESEHGPKLELRFALPDAMDSGVWKQIPDNDQALLRSLIEQLPDILGSLKGKHNHISRDWEEWKTLAANMRRIHKSKDKKVKK